MCFRLSSFFLLRILGTSTVVVKYLLSARLFKGREARLNRAIFQILVMEGPLTIYEIYKNVRKIKGLRLAYYGNVNKRVRNLEHCGYLKTASTQNTKASFKTLAYELSNKACLAMILETISMSELVESVQEDYAIGLLGELLTPWKTNAQTQPCYVLKN